MENVILKSFPATEIYTHKRNLYFHPGRIYGYQRYLQLTTQTSLKIKETTPGTNNIWSPPVFLNTQHALHFPSASFLLSNSRQVAIQLARWAHRPQAR